MQKVCIFCNHVKFELVGENDRSYAIRDKFPVKKLHTLVISKGHYDNIFKLPSSELESIFNLAKVCRKFILQEDETVKGFNFGSNSGVVAGQKIQHVHFHLIPRRIGDVEPPFAR